MDGSCPDPAERPLEDDPIATDQFVPGDGELLTTVIDLIECERAVDLAREAPLGETVDWDALDGLLDDEVRSMNVESVTFSYHDVVVRISGTGRVALYDAPTAEPSCSSGTAADVSADDVADDS